MMNADWIVPTWRVAPRVKSFITTRAGGVSQAPFDSLNLSYRVGDDERAVDANRDYIRALVPSEPFWLQQVHGATVIEAFTPARASGAADFATLPAADAAFTREPSVVLAISIADCMPVLVSDVKGSVIGAAHAGWRGLCGGVIENLVHAMGIAPADALVYLGPCIGPAQFEVGDEVRAAFVATNSLATEAFKPYPNRSGKWLAAMPLLARQRLAAMGITQVSGGMQCTVSDPRFFSFRRDKTTGRMNAFAWLSPNAGG